MKWWMLNVVIALNLFFSAAQAQPVRTVFPTNFENQGGNSGDPVFAGTVQAYQELFRASSLSSIWQSPVEITAIGFRVENGDTRAFDAVYPQIEIHLSTSSRAPEQMSQSYFSNRGVDEKVVYRQNNVRILATGNQPLNPFEVRFEFDAPFLYDPQLGHLFMYITHGQPGGNGVDLPLDGHMFGGLNSTTPFASFGSGTFGAPTGYGAIPQFTWASVPEPTTVTLLGLGAGLIFGSLRRKKQMRSIL
jgi:hypothetical protein